MKNLPEKIYLQEPTKVRTQKMYDNDIEYVHKDAFIEKACDWLEQTLEPYIPYCNIDTDLAIEKFKKYMED